MTLMEAWKDSLQLCKPQAMKLMFLVTLNAMRQAMRALWAFWFIVPVIVLGIASVILNSVVPSIFMYGFTVGAIFIAARPSIQIKNWDYVRSYFLVYLRFVGALLLGIIAIVTCAYLWELLFVPFGHFYPVLFSDQPRVPWHVVDYIATFPGTALGMFALTLHIFNFILFVALFYFDKVGSILTACKKSLILIIYNLPLVIVYSLIIWALKIPIYILSDRISKWLYIHSYSGLSYYVFSLIFFFLHLLIFCLISNIYTKRVHDQYYIYQ
jgi:hypothetical protein